MKTKTIWKRIASLAMALVMVLGMLPTFPLTARAADYVVTKPVLHTTEVYFTGENERLSVTLGEAASGYDMLYSVDQGFAVPANNPLYVSIPGTYTVKYWINDTDLESGKLYNFVYGPEVFGTVTMHKAIPEYATMPVANHTTNNVPWDKAHTLLSQEAVPDLPGYFAVQYNIRCYDSGTDTWVDLPNSGWTTKAPTTGVSGNGKYEVQYKQVRNGDQFWIGNVGYDWDDLLDEEAINNQQIGTIIVNVGPDASVTAAPVENSSITYNGREQELLSSLGTAENGTLWYAVTDATETTAPTTGWSTEKPAATDAGSYKVWYQVKASYQEDIDPQFVTATISSATNTWTTKPSISSYTYGRTPNVTMGKATYGTTAVQYKGTGSTNYNSTVPPTDAGSYQATFTVAGTNNYNELKEEIAFTVSKARNAWSQEPSISSSYTYGETPTVNMGTAQYGNADVLYEGTTAAGVGFFGSGELPTNAGSYKATFTVYGTNNYTGLSMEVPFEILPKTITNDMIQLDESSKPYTGSVIEEPSVTVMDGSKTLFEGTNYDFAWNEDAQWVTPGTNTVTITGKGNYQSSGFKVFTITAGTMTGISADNVTATYDGQGHSITFDRIPEGATVGYGTTEGTYDQTTAPEYTDAGTYTVYYKVSKEHYEDFKGSATVTIQPKAVTVSGITAENKTYDGTANATLGYESVTFGGKLEGDTLSVTATGIFEDKNAGEGKNVTISGLILSGASAGNYELAEVGQQTAATATISPKTVNAAVTAENKTYDGNTTASVSATVDTGINGETITINGLTGTFADANVGTGKTVTVDSASAVVSCSENTQAGNYSLSIPETTTASITAALMTVTAQGYEGTYDGREHGIAVNAPEGAVIKYGTTEDSCNEDSLKYKNAGEYTVYYQVTKDNYEPATGSAAVKISQKTVHATFSIANQTYTGSPIEPKVVLTDIKEVVDGDTLVLNTDYIVTYSGEHTGVGQVNVTVSPVATSNYSVSASGAFQILKNNENNWTTPPAIDDWTYGEAAKKPTAAAKFGDVNVTYAKKGTESFTEAVPTQAGEYTAKFTVADSNDYNGLTETVDFTIEKKALTVTEATATGREYDGTKTVVITKVELDGIVGEDTVAVDVAELTGTLESANKGPYTSVTLPELTLINDNGNYTLTQPTEAVKTNVTIDPKTITVTVEGVADQTWTGTDRTPAKITAEGLVAETDEYYTVTYMDNINVGLATVKVEEKGNYTFTAIEKPFLINPNESLIYGLTTENVTSDSKDNVDTAVEMMNNATLEDAPEGEDWQALKTLANALQDRLEAADAADETQNILAVKDINDGNVKLDQKQNLEKALEDLEAAKENYSGNYTDTQKAALEADIQRIEDALAAIERVEDFNTAIDNSLLTENVTTDMDEATEQAIKDAQAAYNKLTEYEKTLVDSADKTKLDTLVATITAYKITKGDGGRYTVGSGKTLSFTANGPARKLDYVQVNGKTIASSNYTVTEGSTIITLKSSYLDKLGYGKHKLQIFYTDGSTDVVDFRIYVSGGNPFTGDSMNLTLMGGAAMTSLLGIAMLILFFPRKKGKYQR